MVTTYTDAIVATPIIMTVGFLPMGVLDPHVSGSGEYVLRLGSQSALALGAGYTPTLTGHETVGTIGWRSFSSETAPLGSFYEFAVHAGGARVESHPTLQPVYGISARIGNLRESRFSGLAFTYGVGPQLLMVGKELHAKINLNFGLGMLLGKEVTIQ